MTLFRVSGMFKMGREWNKFTLEVEAETEKFALEKVYSLLGSRHRTKRRHIRIEEVVKVDGSLEHDQGGESGNKAGS